MSDTAPIRRASRIVRTRLMTAYWAVVGILGLGTPITDRRAMYGDDPANDPYSTDFATGRATRR